MSPSICLMSSLRPNTNPIFVVIPMLQKFSWLISTQMDPTQLGGVVDNALAAKLKPWRGCHCSNHQPLYCAQPPITDSLFCPEAACWSAEVVSVTGNPHVMQQLPIPLPKRTHTHEYRYRFLTYAGRGFCSFMGLLTHRLPICINNIYCRYIQLITGSCIMYMSWMTWT